MNGFICYFFLPTIVFFPLYDVLRRLFFNLPLHRDSGFYVSNHTICSQKFSYREGWNAKYGFCSKVLPEFFYSLVYLKHGRTKFKFYSRYYYSFYNYATAIAVGFCAYIVTNDAWSYALALIIYGMISSHPFFGVYFENGEQFEVLFQAVGFGIIFLGFKQSNLILLSSGIALWVLESFFIKTVSLLSIFVIEVGIVYWKRSYLPAILIVDVVCFLIYLCWMHFHAQSFSSVFFRAVQHERYYQGQPLLKKVFQQFYRKLHLYLRCLWTDLPVFLIFAAAGIFLYGKTTPLLLLYLIAVSLTSFLQAALVWYYLIPLLSPLVLYASFAAIHLFSKGFAGSFAAICSLFIWFASYFMIYSGPIEKVNWHVWIPYGRFMGNQNRTIDVISEKVKTYVKQQSLFIYGVTNQLYLLSGASYPTNLISGGAWLDQMEPLWQMLLNRQFSENPPRFIFSSDEFFYADILRDDLGLDYWVVESYDNGLRLYEFKGKIGSCRESNFSCRPYATGLVMKAREQKVY